MTPEENELLKQMVEELSAVRSTLTEHRRLTAGLFGMVFGILKQIEGCPSVDAIIDQVASYLPDTTKEATAEWLELVRMISEKVGAGDQD